MEFLKCQDVHWKGPEKKSKLDLATTTLNILTHVVRVYAGSRQPTYLHSVSFWGKYT